MSECEPQPATDTGESKRPVAHVIRFERRSAPTPEYARSPRLSGFPAPHPLIGRERELTALCDLLEQRQHPIVSITGPGGVGKTRLALAAAVDRVDRYRDGAVFVPLAGVADPALVLPAIARALDVREMGATPLPEMIRLALRGRELLLVLDTFEHLLDATPDLSSLLDACPGVTLLVTTRAPLRLSGEQRFPVPPLALPAADAVATPDVVSAFGAVALFAARARQVHPSFALDASNAEPVAAICRRLDGLPLAIELAAAWVRLLPVPALLRRLEPRLPLLTGGGHDRPQRLRTMRDAIAWSHDLLADSERRLFRRLAMFAGGFTFPAAECVAAAVSPDEGARASATLEVLAALVDRNLVAQLEPDAAEPRFVLLDTVREFALEQLAASGERAAVAAAHAACMRELAERAAPHLFGPDERAWYARLDTELDNLHAAIAWGTAHDPELALRIGAVLSPYWLVRSNLSDTRRWLLAALERSGDVPAAVRSRALTSVAALDVLRTDFEQVEVLGAEAVVLARQAEDRIAEATALMVKASAPWATGRPLEALPDFERSTVLFATAESTTDRAWAAHVHSLHGTAAFMLGDVDDARLRFEEALRLHRLNGSDTLTLMALSAYSDVLVATGRLAEARMVIAEAVDLAIRHGEGWQIGRALFAMAIVDVAEGHAALGARRLGAAEVVIASVGVVAPEPHQQVMDHAIDQARSAIGGDRFDAERAAGRADPAAVIAVLADRVAVVASAPAPPALTPREQEITRLLVAGHSDRFIAEFLSISRKTVSNHVASILRKLEVETRTAAAAKAVREGWTA